MDSFGGRLPGAAEPTPSAPIVGLDSKLYLKASQAVAMLQDVLEEWPHAKTGQAGQDTGEGTFSEGGDLITHLVDLRSDEISMPLWNMFVEREWLRGMRPATDAEAADINDTDARQFLLCEPVQD